MPTSELVLCLPTRGLEHHGTTSLTPRYSSTFLPVAYCMLIRFQNARGESPLRCESYGEGADRDKVTFCLYPSNF